jgi:hypothetical protein
MITVMIKYHDPALARYLENYEIEPQIYCISWLMTLFSRYGPIHSANCQLNSPIRCGS